MFYWLLSTPASLMALSVVCSTYTVEVSFTSKILHIYFPHPCSWLYLCPLNILWDLWESSVTNASVYTSQNKLVSPCVLSHSEEVYCAEWYIQTHSINWYVLQQRTSCGVPEKKLASIWGCTFFNQAPCCKMVGAVIYTVSFFLCYLESSVHILT